MRLYLLLVVILFGCAAKKKTPAEMIIGSWKYANAERLGDHQKNDPQSMEEYNKSYEGKMLIFNKDNTYIQRQKTATIDTVLVTGRYKISEDGKSILLERAVTMKIDLTDTVFKVHTPDNGVFVWRKMDE